VACLTIDVIYLSHFETFALYGKPPYSYYLLFGLSLPLFLVLLRIVLRQLGVDLHFLSACKLSLFPILKGYIMALSLCSLFVVILFYIADRTQYRSITTNYDNIEISDPWRAYAGRTGLSTLLAGFFLLCAGVGQGCKALSIEEARLVLEDDMLERRNQGGAASE
jgi:hypothetical protein